MGVLYTSVEVGCAEWSVGVCWMSRGGAVVVRCGMVQFSFKFTSGVSLDAVDVAGCCFQRAACC
jgi:hypothetical protein